MTDVTKPKIVKIGPPAKKPVVKSADRLKPPRTTKSVIVDGLKI